MEKNSTAHLLWERVRARHLGVNESSVSTWLNWRANLLPLSAVREGPFPARFAEKRTLVIEDNLVLPLKPQLAGRRLRRSALPFEEILGAGAQSRFAGQPKSLDKCPKPAYTQAVCCEVSPMPGPPRETE